jgi:hypothetical protein
LSLERELQQIIQRSQPTTVLVNSAFSLVANGTPKQQSSDYQRMLQIVQKCKTAAHKLALYLLKT